MERDLIITLLVLLVVVVVYRLWLGTRYWIYNDEIDETVDETAEVRASDYHQPEWRLDAAVPEAVTVGRAFDLAVAVLPVAAPPLQVDELTRVRSGEARIEWPSKQSVVTLRAAVHAPDCRIEGQPFQMFNLHRGEPSPTVFFSLQPLRAGELLIRVTLYQKIIALGSTRLKALAVEAEAGSVDVEITAARATAAPVPANHFMAPFVPATRASDFLTWLRPEGPPPFWMYPTIFNFLVKAFSMEELKTLSFEIGVPWDDLPGATLQSKASELASYCLRREKMDELVEAIIAARPNWLEYAEGPG